MRWVVFALQFGAAFAISCENPNKRVRESDDGDNKEGAEKKPKIKEEVGVKTEFKEEQYKVDAPPKLQGQAPAVASCNAGFLNPAVGVSSGIAQAAVAKPVGVQQQPINLSRAPTRQPAAAASAAVDTPFPSGFEVDSFTISTETLQWYVQLNGGFKDVSRTYVEIPEGQIEQARLVICMREPGRAKLVPLPPWAIEIKRGKVYFVNQDKRFIVYVSDHVKTVVDVSDLKSFDVAAAQMRLRQLQSVGTPQQPLRSPQAIATFTPTDEWRHVAGDIPSEFQGRCEFRQNGCKVEARLQPFVGAAGAEPEVEFPVGQDVDYLTIRRDLEARIRPAEIAADGNYLVLSPGAYAIDKMQVRYVSHDGKNVKYVALHPNEIVLMRGKVQRAWDDGWRILDFGPGFASSAAQVSQLSSFSRNSAKQMLTRRVSNQPIV